MGQLWGKALQVKGFMKNTWLVRYEGPPGVGHWPSSATRGTLYGHVLGGLWLVGGPSCDPTLLTVTTHTFLEARNSMPLATW